MKLDYQKGYILWQYEDKGSCKFGAYFGSITKRKQGPLFFHKALVF
jgi:hypothetical protein